MADEGADQPDEVLLNSVSKQAKEGKVHFLVLAHATTRPFPAREDVAASRKAKKSIAVAAAAASS